ncbi:hypothetical protein BJ684DRAFT_21484 [Piptocephalis cylindrospora]|uniref:Biogenesis of lysosome-related organelles complex 1 subunit 7 n=1 Tax=Piptocephalis cylindrospora TaxID=1907219 RepID=A0A4P9XZM0_9FUNG|nr:hypothetical protein BJ684DRAFT_21484 [Piptocephalis cylindrospora]|eukprot:RKP11938.1 hypothetical protein BJ684DRAFT_21484 [Piptocephalis cylindrospora]
MTSTPSRPSSLHSRCSSIEDRGGLGVRTRPLSRPASRNSQGPGWRGGEGEEEEEGEPYRLTQDQQRRLAQLRISSSPSPSPSPSSSPTTRQLSLNLPSRPSSSSRAEGEQRRAESLREASRPVSPSLPAASSPGNMPSSTPHFAHGLLNLLRPIMTEMMGQADGARKAQSDLEAEISEARERLQSFMDAARFNPTVKVAVSKVDTLHHRLALVNMALERSLERMERCRITLEQGVVSSTVEAGGDGDGA